MNSIAIVTGSSGGIGSEVCRQLLHDGFVVVGVDRVPSEFTNVIWEMRDVPPDGTFPTFDYGRVEVIVHCAATQPTEMLVETSREQWLEAIKVNVLALDHLVKEYFEDLSASRGTILAVSSVHAFETSSRMSAYAASKAALNSWVRSAAIELGPDVFTAGIALGAIDTPKLREGLERWSPTERKAKLQQLIDRTPVGRLGFAAEIAGWVSFLASGSARFSSGSVIRIDGGVSARLSSE